MMKMSELKIGDKGEVISVDAKGEILSRLISMGLVKGVKFKVERKAPLGDPIVIKTKGYLLSLRLNEAKDIAVNRLGEVGDGKPLSGSASKKNRNRGHGHG